MARSHKFSFLSYFLSISMLFGTGMTSLTSCIKDADEPVWEDSDDKDDDNKDDDNKEDENKPGDDNGDNEDPGNSNDPENPDEPGADTPSGDVNLTDNLKNLTLGQNVTATAVVAALNDRGLVLADKAGAVYLYNQNLNLSNYPVGTVVSVSGKLTNFGTGLQFDASASIDIVGKESYTYPTPKVYTGADVTAAANNADYVASSYVSVTGKLNISGNYYNIEIEGASVQGSVSYPNAELKSQLKDGSNYTFTGYFTGISGSSTKYFNVVVTAFKLNDNNNGSQDKPDSSVSVPSVFSSEPYGYVVLPSDVAQQYKGYTGFNVSYNKDYHAPNYVAWELTSAEATSNNTTTSRDYWQDSSITGCAPVSQGWFDLGYDRGHMCPAADQKWSSKAMDDAAVMANICPQLSSYNQGIWAKLEGKERDWAKTYGSIYIICGPIYTDVDQTYIGSARTRVAGAFFKAFLYYNGANSRAIAYVIPHLSSGLGSYSAYAMSIDDLEKATGYDFFSALPDDIEKVVEASYDPSKWQ